MFSRIVVLFLVFQATHSHVLTFDEDACGSGKVKVVDVPPDGDVTSRNYPNNYPSNERCSWHLRTVSQLAITIVVKDFSTESGYDYLNVHDGDSTSAPRLGRFSGTNLPPVITSSGANMFLYFSSDSSVVSRGFILTYTTAVQGCGPLQPAVIEDLNGVISSPNWPDMYFDNTQCSWSIIAPEDYVIQADFSDFNTRQDSDILVIFDNLEAEGDILATLSGQLSTPFSAVSTDNAMFLQFSTSDYVSDYGGWWLTFSAYFVDPGCQPGQPAVLLDDTGDITSGNFPNYYPSSENCGWLIYSNDSQYEISLNFTHMDTLQNIDVVRVYDGNSTNAPLLLGASGNVVPPPVYSSSNSMLILFSTSAELSNNLGWRIGFTSFWACKDIYAECSSWAADGWCTRCSSFMHDDCPDACGLCSGKVVADRPKDSIACGPSQPLHLSDTSGEIFSRNWPSNYPDNENCSWVITAPEGEVLQLDFTHFHTEECVDILNIYDGDTANASSLIGSFCGDQVPVGRTTTTNKMTITFTSDGSNNFVGWRAIYNRVVDEPACKVGRPRVVNGTVPGSLRSRNWPFYYPGDDHCDWLIQADAHQILGLSFSHFDTRMCTDTVKVFDGNSTNSPLLLNACGNTIPNAVNTTSRSMYVSFQATGTGINYSAGWRASYSPTIVCQNLEPQCNSWASDGWCNRCPHYMNIYCYQACGNC